MAFSVQVLGTSSAIDAFGRHQSAQLFRTDEHVFLIDCGEGTQARLKKHKVNTNKIQGIFISHLHGDHYLGLVGLLSTMSLLGRRKKLLLYGPPELKDIIRIQFSCSGTVLNYDLNFVQTQNKTAEVIFSSPSLTIKTIPLCHGVPCTGFLFKESKKPFRINPETLPPSLERKHILELKKGNDITLESGEILYAADLTLLPKKSRSYAYCTDTLMKLEISKFISGIDLLYHETTFLNKHESKALNTNHSTCKQAAELAKEAQVKHLIMGHFSARYENLDEFTIEAQETFLHAEVALEGTIYSISDVVTEPILSKK